ncbi:MAG TPA: hypothetical protein VFT43_03025 [Candidatus Polarisedimenticolia bacterium]|nr:hypothetical protein [Candidatus Polarisedimenticolia bacterium]
MGAVTGMTGGGWGFLILAWGGIIAATFFCFYRLFQSEDKKR